MGINSHMIISKRGVEGMSSVE